LLTTCALFADKGPVKRQSLTGIVLHFIPL